MWLLEEKVRPDRREYHKKLRDVARQSEVRVLRVIEGVLPYGTNAIWIEVTLRNVHDFKVIQACPVDFPDKSGDYQVNQCGNCQQLETEKLLVMCFERVSMPLVHINHERNVDENVPFQTDHETTNLCCCVINSML